MAGTIKGITIEFRGDTTKLDKAIREIDKNTRSLNKDLKDVDNALKFNPTNVELWRQKQELLTKKVAETKDKLDALKQAQAQLDAQGVDKTSAEYQKLERDIIKTESQLKNFEGQLKSIGNVKLKAVSEQFNAIGTGLDNAGQKMKGLSIAAAAATAAVGALAVKSGAAADDLNTLSKVTGIGTDELQKYSYAADLVDVSVEDIAKANQKLKKSAYAAADGTGSQAEAFNKLGVSVLDSNGELKDSETLFQEVVTALGGVENETERAALAQELMGKSAANLNPLIEDGGETYKRVSETLKKYNLDFIDQETLDKANEFNDELDTMKLLGSVALAQLGSQLAASLAPVLEKVVDLAGRLAEWLGNLDPKVLTIIATVGAVIAVLAPLLIGLGKVAFAISSLISLFGVVGPAIAAIAGPIGIVIAIAAALVAAGVLIYKNWDKIKETAQIVGQKIKEIWTSVKTSVINAVNSLKTGLSNAWTAIKNAVTKAAKTWFDAMTWPYRKAWDIIKGIIDKIKGLFPIDIKSFFSKIKLPHFSWDWMDIGGIISIPKIHVDWYKTGGIFDAPTIAGIGEAGPEAVVPLDKFWDKMDAIAAASQGSGTAPVINIYPTPTQSPTDVAREVERVLVNWQKQRSAAYGNI